MENSLSASDVAMLAGNNDGFGNGWGGMIWLFAILALMGGGFGFGGGNNAEAIQADVNRGFDNQNLQAQTRDILAAVTAGTAQSVATTNQVYHDTVNALNDKYSEINRDIAALQVGQAQSLANQNECCCSTKMLISETGNSLAAQIAGMEQRFMAKLDQNEITALRDQVQQLQLNQAMAGVVRYPTGWSYDAGNPPFCNCTTTSTPTTTG